MFSEEIKETVYLSITLFMISLVLIFLMAGVRLRSDMANVRNSEVQTGVEMQSYRRFNKYLGGSQMYGEDVIEAVRGFSGTDIEVYVDSVNGGDIYIQRDMTIAQIESMYSVEKLQNMVPLGVPYDVYLVYDYENIKTAGKPTENDRFTEVSGIVFKRK